MELKDRKFINNTGKLPRFDVGKVDTSTLPKPGYLDTSGAQANVQNILRQSPNIQRQNTSVRGETKGIGSPASSSAAAAGPGFAIGSWLGGGVLEGIGAFRKSSDEYLAEAGTTQRNINGIGYTTQNSVDTSKIMNEYDNEAGSAWLTNPGKAITMLFGRSAAKRRAQDAALTANLKQDIAKDNAYAQYLRLDNAKKYGNTEDQILYAKNGKLAECKDGLVSAAGKVNGEATARVSNGEVIANKTLGIMYRVPGLKNNKDGKLAALNNSDTVVTNKYGLSDYAWETGDIEGAEAMMKMVGKPKYKCGKLPKLAEGWTGNFIPAVLGTAASLDQMFRAYRNKPYNPNTYAANPYESEGLTTLASLRINPYPIMNQLRSAENRTNRAIDIAGGLSGAQRTSARLANLNTTQNNIANMLSNIQAQNNAYKSKYAESALQAGQNARLARMSANQWDLDMYAKANAARNKGIQTGIANMLSQIQQYQANEFKRRQFNDTMDLYRADQKQRQQQMNWIQNQSTRGIGLNPMYYDPTQPLYRYDEATKSYIRV